MEQVMRDMASAMAAKIRIARHFVVGYENKRQCPFHSEWKGMELALKAMGIPYDYEFDDETYEITAVIVAGQRAEV